MNGLPEPKNQNNVPGVSGMAGTKKEKKGIDMYLVEPSIFKMFIDKNNFDNKIIPKPNVLPCIFVFNSGGVLKAKIETKNFDELLDIVKFNRSIVLPENKYWIRGNEWKVNAKGEKIRILKV